MDKLGRFLLARKYEIEHDDLFFVLQELKTQMHELDYWLEMRRGRGPYPADLNAGMSDFVMKYSTPFCGTLFRGTKLPVPYGGPYSTPKNARKLKSFLKKFYKNFDKGVVVVTDEVISTSSSRKVAKSYAEDRDDDYVVQNNGFIHIFEAPINVPVLNLEALSKEVSKNHDLLDATIFNPGILKEYLLPIGSRLMPQSRDGNILRWVLMGPE